MSEMPRDAAQLAPDLVQALMLLCKRRTVLGMLYAALVRANTGAKLMDLVHYARQRGFTRRKLNPPNVEIQLMLQHDLLTRAVMIDPVHKNRYYRYHITSKGKQVLALFETVDMDTL